MDYSSGLITKVVDDEALNIARRSGIDQTFLAEDCIPVFNYLERHYANYKVVPTRDAVKAAFPNFEFVETRQPLEYFTDALTERFQSGIVEKYLDQVSSTYTKDIKGASQLLREAISELAVTQKTFRDVRVAEGVEDRLAAYKLRAENPGATGVLSGWQALDYETLGWKEEDFIVLVGEKWMGKSWQMLQLAKVAAKAGERVLFITREMSQEEIVRRWDALYGGFSYDGLRRGELDPVELGQYERSLKEQEERNIHFTVARQGVDTISDIEFKAVECDATIVFVDSVYLFNPDRTGRHNNETTRRMAISQKCKQIAQQLAVPFIVSVQAGRKSSKNAEPNLDDIEYSNAFSQDANTVLYLHKDELDKELLRAQMHLLKCRDGGQQIKFFIEQDFKFMNFKQREDDFAPSTDVFNDDDEGIFGEDVLADV